MTSIGERCLAVGGRSPSIALPRALRVTLRAVAVLGIAALAFHIAHGQLGLGGAAWNKFAYNWVYDGAVIGGAISCLIRGLTVERERGAWLLLGAALAFDATGEVYYTFAFGDSGNPPIPSLADLFYLLYYACAYAGLVLLVRPRVERFSTSTCVDGAIAAITSAAVIAALAFEPIASAATTGDPAAIATNLAYPVGDLILLALVIGVFALSGWRPGRAWLLLGIGLALSAVADTAYLYESAKGTYVVGGVLDSIWIASALTIGFAAWQPLTAEKPFRLEGRRLAAVPVACALASLAVLLYGGLHHVSAVGLALAGTAVILVFGRAAWTFHENSLLLAASRRDALTDALTGLGNRRAMSARLERLLTESSYSSPAVLVIFDLDGFKLYNDRFGHVAGDSLLAHLGLQLRSSIADAGSAYRLGGDEFCVLLDCGSPAAARHIAAAVAALSAAGDGFTVRTSHGKVEIPTEAQTSTAALRIADDRMYAHKGGGRGSAVQQTHDVLLGVLREREPKLHHHLCQVGRLATAVGRNLLMDDHELAQLRRAAELHDIGKAAIPDAILNKPGRLEPHEWAFIARHTLVGERILLEAPALSQVATIVRSSHERWDGDGYPDRLSFEQIPLGARVVHVCDAYDAMTSDRPYAAAISREDAIAELRRHAGTQFDPDVVNAFIAALREIEDGERPTPVAAQVA